MSTYKPKGKPHYLFDFRFRGRRFHGSTGCATKRAADEFERRERAKAALGADARPPITIDAAVGTYVANRLTGKPDLKNAIGRGKRLVSHFGAAALLSEIRAAELAAFAAARRAQVADSTTNRDLEFLRRVWRYAAEELGRDVGKPIPWNKLRYAEPEERVREMAPAEERRLFEHLRADVADFFAFAMIRGVRRAGLLGLRWRDVDFEAGTMTYVVKGSRTKPGGPRTKRLTAAELAILRRQPKAGPFVFTYVAQATRRSFTRPDGRTIPGRIKGERYPLTADVVQRAMREACDAAGIADLRFHDATRHTAATRLARSAGNLKLVQAMLDHRDIKTTARYAHATEDDLHRAMSEVAPAPAPAAVEQEEQRA